MTVENLLEPRFLLGCFDTLIKLEPDDHHLIWPFLETPEQLVDYGSPGPLKITAHGGHTSNRYGNRIAENRSCWRVCWPYKQGQRREERSKKQRVAFCLWMKLIA